MKRSPTPAPSCPALTNGPHNGDEAEMAFLGYRRVLKRDKTAHVHRHFDTIAGKYDLMNTILSVGMHHLWKRQAIGMLRLRPGGSVLDVCGGTADLSILAARAVGVEGRIILCDLNHAMMARGQAKVARASLVGRIHFVQGNAEVLPFQEGLFDAVMVGFGVRNLTQMDEGLREMRRVLKPGGKMMCLEFSLPTSAWFRLLYDMYSFHLMPILGKVLAGTGDVYRYLPESIRMFPAPDDFAASLRKIGFINVNYRRLTKGIAVVYTGEAAI